MKLVTFGLSLFFLLLASTELESKWKFPSPRACLSSLLHSKPEKNSALSVRSNSKKVELVVEALEQVFGSPIATLAGQRVDIFKRVAAEAKLVEGKNLTRSEVDRIVWILADFYKPADQVKESWVVRWALKGVRPSLRHRVLRAIRSNLDFVNLIKDFESRGLVAPRNKVGWTLNRVTPSRNTVALARSALLNTVLVLLNIPFLIPPDIHPMDYVGIDQMTEDCVESYGPESLECVEAYCRPIPHTTHISYRGLRRAYLIGLVTWAASYVLFNPQGVIQFGQMTWNATLYRLVSEDDVRLHEQENYSADAVVEEQLQMWLDAQRESPSEEEIEQMRQFFVHQEQQGILRIFDEPE